MAASVWTASLGVLDPPRLDDLEPVILYGCDDGLKAHAFEVVGVEAGCADQKRETLEEIHRHAAPCQSAWSDRSMTNA